MKNCFNRVIADQQSLIVSYKTLSFHFQNASVKSINRAMTAKRRSSNVQTHGLAPMAPLREGAEDHIALTRVDEVSGLFIELIRRNAINALANLHRLFCSQHFIRKAEPRKMDHDFKVLVHAHAHNFALHQHIQC